MLEDPGLPGPRCCRPVTCTCLGRCLALAGAECSRCSGCLRCCFSKKPEPEGELGGMQECTRGVGGRMGSRISARGVWGGGWAAEQVHEEGGGEDGQQSKCTRGVGGRMGSRANARGGWGGGGAAEQMHEGGGGRMGSRANAWRGGWAAEQMHEGGEGEVGQQSK